MKKILALLLASFIAFSATACSTEPAPAESSETPAESVVLTGSAKGFGGDINVEVIMEGDIIKEIKIGEHQETPSIGTAAIDAIPAAITENQSIAVEAVSGATVTGDAIIAAVSAALINGGYDIANYSKEVEAVVGEKTAETLEADIAIIGAGGAGLTAAIEAKMAGKDVVIFEKMPFAGGNTVKATGGMNAAETSIQAAEGIEDTVEIFIEDTLTGGYDIGNPELVTKMAEDSAEAVEWLASVGAPLTQVSFSGGATNSRIHQPEGGAAVGAFLVESLVAKAEELEIEIIYNTEVTEILMQDGKAVGVKATSDTVDYMVNSEAVILASGGFGANEEMYASYRPDLAGFVTTNHAGATGDGIAMATAVGAGTVDVEQIQIHPTVHQETSIMITEGVRGDGGILVNQAGERFINEMETRDVVSAAEIAQEGGYAYVIFDQNLREHLSATEKYITNGITVEGETIEELAAALEIDPTVLSETLNTWNAAVASGTDAQFGRTTGMESDLSTGPYYAVKVSPGVHHTMGGVAIDVNARVLTAEGEVIPGLFAAGEVTGGIHGGNRIGGNAVTDIVVFGRVAAESATAYVGE